MSGLLKRANRGRSRSNKRGTGSIASAIYRPPPSDDEDEPESSTRQLPPKVNVKSSTVSLDDNGDIHTRTQYVHTDASPQKSRESRPTHQWNTESLPQPVFQPPDNDDGSLDPAYVEHVDNMNDSVRKKRKRPPTDLSTWEPLLDEVLAELLRLEGRAGFTGTSCPRCHENEPKYRCRDCFGHKLYCASCTVDFHSHNPLHRLQYWNGSFFDNVTSKSLGLRIQLGHPVGEKCSNPFTATNDDFVVLDEHGIQEVGLDYCNCMSAKPRMNQILRAGWFPATTKNPKTAVTFRMLERFHLLSFESKISAFEFYYSLARKTDNTGVNPPKDRYVAFLLIMRLWRHLKMLKRTGRGHDPNGVASTKQGQCALLCPACPQPGKNLPEGWEDSKENGWLYALFLAIDANFRLQRKNVSNDLKDPGLGSGWAYFVENLDFKKYLLENDTKIQEPSTCTGHTAVNNADNQCGTMATSGCGTVDCARHEMKRPNAVGDLQRGERYVNMDYFFFSSLRNTSINRLFVSYDIACQWHKNLWARMEERFDHSWRIDHKERTKVTFLVPKFHLPAHVEKCHNEFSFNITKGVARTDGEGNERGWFRSNPLSASTREMGPGSRRNVIDDHNGDNNWSKTTGMGVFLLRKIKLAVVERADQTHAHNLLTEAILAKAIEEWVTAVEQWEEDPLNNDNPFVRQVKALTQAGVRKELAEAESNQQAVSDIVVHEEISPAVFITSGLDLEYQQRCLEFDRASLGPHSTDLQHAKIRERSNRLQRKIDSWCQLQEAYMPGASVLRSKDLRKRTVVHPEAVPLWLPSAVGDKALCSDRLRNYEWRLRHAQAHEALNEIRHNLRLRSHLYKFKDHFVRGQRAITRSWGIIQRVQNKVDVAAKKYQIARAALIALTPYAHEAVANELEWETVLQPLDIEKDVTGMTESGYHLNEGKRKLSWIWLTSGQAIMSYPCNTILL